MLTVAQFWKLVDRQLVGVLEEIEDRVPNKQELQRHGLIVNSSDGGMEFHWKGERVLQVILESDPLVLPAESPSPTRRYRVITERSLKPGEDERNQP